MFASYNPSPVVLNEIEARFAPINIAARQGTYTDALGDTAATATYLSEYATHKLVQSVLQQLKAGKMPESAGGRSKSQPRPGAKQRPNIKPLKPW